MSLGDSNTDDYKHMAAAVENEVGNSVIKQVTIWIIKRYITFNVDYK